MRPCSPKNRRILSASLGIIVGLTLVKPIGITLLSKIMVKLRLASLPEGTTWSHIYGVGFLAGIGFTMSIFISDLAFEAEMDRQIAKVGIFAASILSALIGMVLLSMAGLGRQRSLGEAP